MITKEIYLDFQRKEVKSITVSRYDKDSRTFLCHFSNDGEPFDFTKLSVVVKMLKPDGTLVVNNCEIVDNVVVLTFTEQMCIVDGHGELQFMVYDANEVLYTATVHVHIYKAVFDDDSIVSTSEFSAFNEAMEKSSEYIAETKAAAESAKQSEVLTKQYSDSAKTYAEKSEDIYKNIGGALLPKGTITFAELPVLADVKPGWMYNIKNSFTTTTLFKDGAGILMPAGTNVYKTDDNLWDCLAGNIVSGVKGNAETTYRVGNINITLANLGYELANDDDVDKIFTEGGNE